MIRLNKYLARCGVASRRACDELISQGRVKVNGKVVKELGVVVDENSDRVEFDGKLMDSSKKENFIYVLLNKPQEVISTADDEFNRETVVDLIAAPQRIYPVGRLDFQTTGVLLLTNDGELTNRLIHPRYKVTKVYHALIDRKIKPVDLYHLRNGVELDGKKTLPCKIEEMRIVDNQSFLKIELREGRNRQIRRMFEAVGYQVEELDRVAFGGLTYGGLHRGEWRYLRPAEVQQLQNLVNESPVS